MSYYQLRCATHSELFKPLVATSPDELLVPDYEAAAEDAGTFNSNSLKEFHEAHRGCVLETVEL